MSNPYQAPKGYFSDEPQQPAQPPPGSLTPGLVNMVRVVAILMIVQGVLEMMMALFLLSMGIFMCVVFLTENDPNQPAEVGWIMLGVYGGMGLVHFIPAALYLLAGMRNYRYRGRTLGFVALASGLLTLLGCYCLPTSIALAVFGLIVYCDSSVAKAFEMGEQGMEGDQIIVAFLRPAGLR